MKYIKNSDRLTQLRVRTISMCNHLNWIITSSSDQIKLLAGSTDSQYVSMRVSQQTSLRPLDQSTPYIRRRWTNQRLTCGHRWTNQRLTYGRCWSNQRLTYARKMDKSTSNIRLDRVNLHFKSMLK